MNIAHADLQKQFYRARAQWPFIDEIERRYGLPRCLLYAVGSRETNLTDEVGDGGHGRGVFQLDDRSHKIPDPFPVEQQADIAGQMLRGLIDYFGGNLESALCAYNAGAGRVERAVKAGRDPNSVTTGKDYGADVRGRCRFCADLASPTPAPPPAPNPLPVMEDEMPVAFDPINGDFWVLTGPAGGVDARRADGGDSRRYYGNLIDHPEYNAGEGKPLGPAIGIGYWPAGQPVDGEPAGGYVIITRAPDGSYHPYHFDASTVK